MGCNYYLKPQGFGALRDLNKRTVSSLENITEEYKQALIKMRDEANKISPLYSELLDIPSIEDIRVVLQWEMELPEIHICKMSMGWIPCFQNNKYFNSFKEFIKFYEDNKNVFTLVDEYDEVISLDKFVEDLYEFKNHALPTNKRSSYYDIRYTTDEDDFDWIDNDFS